MGEAGPSTKPLTLPVICKISLEIGFQSHGEVTGGDRPDGQLAMARLPDMPHQQVKRLRVWFDYRDLSPRARSQGASQSVPDGRLGTTGRELGIPEPVGGYISSSLRKPQEYQLLPTHPCHRPPFLPHGFYLCWVGLGKHVSRERQTLTNSCPSHPTLQRVPSSPFGTPFSDVIHKCPLFSPWPCPNYPNPVT